MALRRKLSGCSDEVRAYWRECASPRGFVALMRVRLSQSKIGPLITPRPITITIDLATLGRSVRLRSHTTDISVLKELPVGNSYQPLPSDRGVATVVDLGANIGLSHRWLRARYPSARFVCVEPAPGNLELLRWNVRAVDPTAVIVEACIGGHERTVSLVDSDGEWGYRMADDAGSIPVVTMRGVLDEAGMDHVDVLKCDVEGAESEVFADCSKWIGNVDTMIVECHTNVVTTDALRATIASNGGRFDVTHLESNPGLDFDLVTLQAA